MVLSVWLLHLHPSPCKMNIPPPLIHAIFFSARQLGQPDNAACRSKLPARRYMHARATSGPPYPIRDVDAAINHIVKNTMAEAAGLTEMFLDLCTPRPLPQTPKWELSLFAG